MGKHVHNCITKFFESRRDTLAPHASNAQGGPLCKRGGCVRTLRIPPAYGIASTRAEVRSSGGGMGVVTLPDLEAVDSMPNDVSTGLGKLLVRSRLLLQTLSRVHYLFIAHLSALYVI